uniref:50S ribosomal protein L24 n=1 Tax=Parapedobacter tibetensis TaxID=2972951 RepID=UPI00214D3552
MKIRTGDLVKVIAGNSKGAQGKVLEVVVAKNRAIVEGVNLVKKHTKPNAANPNGGIIEKEAAIHISNLAYVDPKSGKPTRIGRKVKEVDGGQKIVRIAKKSGEEID